MGLIDIPTSDLSHQSVGDWGWERTKVWENIGDQYVGSSLDPQTNPAGVSTQLHRLVGIHTDKVSCPAHRQGVLSRT
jgi:hypothetical protein